MALYDNIGEVTADSLVSAIREAIRPDTRVLALTWVHSSTGLEIPLASPSIPNTPRRSTAPLKRSER